MYRPFRTSAWFSWDWLEYLHNRNTPGSVDMQHLCTSGYIPCDAIMVANMTVYLQQLLTTAPSSFSFIYLTRADMTGHNHGWCTPEYLSAVADTDKLVGQILDAVETAKAEVKMPQMLLLSILSRKRMYLKICPLTILSYKGQHAFNQPRPFFTQRHC